MRSTLLLLALSLTVGGLGVSSASAAEPAKKASIKATTTELPAVLQALSPDQDKVLTLSEADGIRGEAWYGWGWGGWGWGGWYGGWNHHHGHWNGHWNHGHWHH